MLDFVYNYQNPRVCTAVSAISGVGRGMSTGFEKADAFLLPTNNVAKKSNKIKNVVIYEVTGTHSGVGTSEVILRW